MISILNNNNPRKTIATWYNKHNINAKLSNYRLNIKSDLNTKSKHGI